MKITISTEKSKEILRRLIRNDFESINFSMEFIYEKADELIALARIYSLSDLADEMENDKIASQKIAAVSSCDAASSYLQCKNKYKIIK